MNARSKSKARTLKGLFDDPVIYSRNFLRENKDELREQSTLMKSSKNNNNKLTATDLRSVASKNQSVAGSTNTSLGEAARKTIANNNNNTNNKQNATGKSVSDVSIAKNYVESCSACSAPLQAEEMHIMMKNQETQTDKIDDEKYLLNALCALKLSEEKAEPSDMPSKTRLSYGCQSDSDEDERAAEDTNSLGVPSSKSKRKLCEPPIYAYDEALNEQYDEPSLDSCSYAAKKYDSRSS